jgi:predicted transcriptional regulator
MPAAKRRAKGRPSKLTPQMADAFLDAIAGGATITGAAELLGVTRETAHNWLKASRSAKPGLDVPDFAARYDLACQARRDRWVEAVADGRLISGERDWKASAWLLERLHAGEFAKKTIQEKVIRSELEQLLETVEPHMSREAYGELLHALAVVHGVDPNEAGPTREGGTVQ